MKAKITRTIIFLIIMLCIISPGLFMRRSDLKDMPEVAWCEGNGNSFTVYNYSPTYHKRREGSFIIRNMNYIGDHRYLGHITDKTADFIGIGIYNSETGDVEHILDDQRIDGSLKGKAGGGGNDCQLFLSDDGDRIYFHSRWLTICCYHRGEDRAEVLAESGGATFFVMKDESYLYYRGDHGRLLKKDLRSGDEEQIIERVNWFAVSEDERYIAHMLTGGPLEIYDTQTKESRVIKSSFAHKTVPVFTKDGKYLLFTDYSEAPLGGYARVFLYVYNIEKNAVHRIYKTSYRTNILGICWKE